MINILFFFFNKIFFYIHLFLAAESSGGRARAQNLFNSLASTLNLGFFRDRIRILRDIKVSLV